VYRIDVRNGSAKEFLWASKGPAGLLAIALAKGLRVPIDGSTDDPNVPALAPFEVPDASAFPADVNERFAPVLESLAPLGFAGPPVYHAIHDDLHRTRTFLATLAHPSGQAVARVHERNWSVSQPPRVKAVRRVPDAAG
jgi:hypothetical protein